MADEGWSTISNKKHKPAPHSTRESDDGGDVVVYSPPKKRTNREGGNSEKFVLILAGIPGSGKSSFAMKLEKLAPHKYARVNQDSLGDRRKCEDLTRKILRQNKIPIIDRCNFSPEQRQIWVDIASDAGVSVECVVFSYSHEVCIRRCRERRYHETISAGNASSVVRKMAKLFEPPVPLDGSKVNVRCRNGEFFRRMECVSSFDVANDLVQQYLQL